MSTSKESSSNAGVQLQILTLTGQDNYLPWVRDFKMTAKSEGVWGFYEGTEEVFAKPIREDYQIPKSRRKRLSADALAEASQHGLVTIHPLTKFQQQVNHVFNEYLDGTTTK